MFGTLILLLPDPPSQGISLSLCFLSETPRILISLSLSLLAAMAVPSLGRTSAARGFLLLSILSLLLFDAAVNAQAMSPSQTRVPARAQRDHQGAVTAPATTSTTASSSLPVPTYFSAQIIVPPSVVLNESTNVAISQQDAEAGSNLVLCQTSASSGSSPSSADTWFVLAIPADGEYTVKSQRQ